MPKATSVSIVARLCISDCQALVKKLRPEVASSTKQTTPIKPQARLVVKCSNSHAAAKQDPAIGGAPIKQRAY
ncbi:hypothetical protein O9929_04505 [Vibrio lentus]|nr:hypothetical protein [Vibrio lentus]